MSLILLERHERQQRAWNRGHDHHLVFQMNGIRYFLTVLGHIIADSFDVIHWYCIRRRRHPLLATGGTRDPAAEKEPLLLVEAVDAWHETISVAYTGESDHVELLKRLWKASFCSDRLGGGCPGDSLSNGHEFMKEEFSANHEMWKEIGFQNTRPESDFRGGGVLSLKCLVYMSEKYPDHYAALVTKRQGTQHDLSEYPFAASYIHMVYSLLDALELRHLNPGSRCSYGFLQAAMRHDSDALDLETVFQEISVHTMMVLDTMWVTSSASYLDFPKVKQKVCRHVRRVVSKRWFDTPSLILTEFHDDTAKKDS